MTERGVIFWITYKKRVKKRNKSSVLSLMYCFQTNTTPVNISLIFPSTYSGFCGLSPKNKGTMFCAKAHCKLWEKSISAYIEKSPPQKLPWSLQLSSLLQERKKNCMVFYPSPYPLWKLFSSPQRKVTKYSSQFICHVNMRFLRPLYLTICEKKQLVISWEKSHM